MKIFKVNENFQIDLSRDELSLIYNSLSNNDRPETNPDYATNIVERLADISKITEAMAVEMSK